MEAEAVLAGLDPEQRAVAEAVRGPVCVLAGAGTGKTRAITHRIAYAVLTGVVSPQRVLAVTFTTRAAGEPRTRPPGRAPPPPLRRAGGARRGRGGGGGKGPQAPPRRVRRRGGQGRAHPAGG